MDCRTFQEAISLFHLSTYPLATENLLAFLKNTQLYNLIQTNCLKLIFEILNEKVLEDVEEKNDIMRYILKRKTKLIGHRFRHNFIRNIFEKKTLRRRTKSHLRTLYSQDLKQLIEVTSYLQIKNVANNKNTLLSQ